MNEYSLAKVQSLIFNVSGLSPFTTPFLRSGQGENFVRPENKFLVPCVPISTLASHLVCDAKVQNFQSDSKFISHKPSFLMVFFVHFCK